MSAETSARSVSHTVFGVGPARALERVLYRCAKQDRNRRFYALAEMVARRTSARGGICLTAAVATTAYACR